jgi:hypothetical protein
MTKKEMEDNIKKDVMEKWLELNQECPVVSMCQQHWIFIYCYHSVSRMLLQFTSSEIKLFLNSGTSMELPVQNK